MNYIFAGDREISVKILEYLVKERNLLPDALLISSSKKQSHAKDLISLCSHLNPETNIFSGTKFREEKNLKLIKELTPDFIIGIHFPYIVPKAILEIPKCGVLNLHPAYLPYNRGWHTPSWAILDGTPYGATLHFMNTKVDEGDIVHQKQIAVEIDDTADSLYQKVAKLEYDVFREAWPSLEQGTYSRKSQNPNEGTAHKRDDLFVTELQKIDLDKSYKARDLLQKLRGLTTSEWKEAAYFKENNKKYQIKVKIKPFGS